MPNRDNTGFRPAEKFGQVIYWMFNVDASSGTALFIGDVVVNNAAGSVRPAAAAFTSTGVGVCVGVYDTNRIPCGHPNSVVTTNYLSASTAGYALVALAMPGQFFIAQSQTGTTYAAADVWTAVNLVAGAGNTSTAHSNHELGATGGADFQIIGLVDEPENTFALGENVDVYVRFLGSVWGQVNPTGGI